LEEDRKEYKVLVRKPKGRRPLGKPRRNGRMGSKWILGRLVWRRSVEWIKMAQDWDQWRTLVNTLINLLFHKRRAISKLLKQPSVSEERVHFKWLDNEVNQIKSYYTVSNSSVRKKY